MQWRSDALGANMRMKALIDLLNQHDFRAFPQKADPKRVSLSVADEKGTRYFLTRAAIGIQDDGSAKYCWVRGSQMRDQKVSE